jgi:hypothetical protein
MAKIIHTDNFAGDYPDEKFVTGLPRLNAEQAKVICDAINSTQPETTDRFYVVVDDDYVLQPGFEP